MHTQRMSVCFVRDKEPFFASCLPEGWRETFRLVIVHLAMWLGVVLYMMMGAVVLTLVEGGVVRVNGTDESQPVLIKKKKTLADVLPKKVKAAPDDNNHIPWNWDFSNSLRFSFSLCTTIGTSEVSPYTNTGKIFTIFFGIVGIPLAMLALADLGKFLMDGVVRLQKSILNHVCCSRKRKRSRNIARIMRNPNGGMGGKQKRAEEEGSDEGCWVIVFFLTYMIFTIWGSPFFHGFEVLNRIYLSFISFTTLGFSEIVLGDGGFSLWTMLYVLLGLILITMSIEAAARAFQKVHNLGAKIKDAGNALIWFGGQSLTVHELLFSFGSKYGIPESKLEKLNLDSIVQSAIRNKRNSKEIRAIQPEDLKLLREAGMVERLLYIDDEDLSDFDSTHEGDGVFV